MCRLLFFLCLIPAPLFAVSVGDKAALELTDLRAGITLSKDEATVTCKATVHNPSDEKLTSQLTLPNELVPEDQRKDYKLKVAGIPRASSTALRWSVDFEPGQRLEIAWVVTLNPVDLPHAHPLGLREVRVSLSHMRGYVALPERVHFTITAADMPVELFESRDSDTEKVDVEVDAHIEDFSYTWFAETWEAKRDALVAIREEFTESQRTHLNRSYTETLVHLADVYAMEDEHAALAEVCVTLTALEKSGRRAITHCGPWARWRKHVPWQLRRVEALQKAGEETKAAAQAAKEHLAVVWAAHLEAGKHPQPFERFDRSKYGNYWDYDWDRTRELYATALELLGENDAAQAVRDTE